MSLPGESHAVVGGVVIHVRRPLGESCAGRGRVGGNVELVCVVVKRERGNGRSVVPLQRIPVPSQRIGLAHKERIVADHVSIHRSQACLLHLLGNQAQNIHGCLRRRAWQILLSRRRGRPRLDVRVVAPADRGIAHAKEHQVAVQSAACIDFAVGGHKRGPGQRVHGQQGKSRRCGRQLGVGRGRKESRVIEPVERLPIECGHTDAEVCVAQRGIGEDGLDSVGKRARRGDTALRTRIAAGLSGSLSLHAQKANQKAAPCQVSPKGDHARKCSKTPQRRGVPSGMSTHEKPGTMAAADADPRTRPAHACDGRREYHSGLLQRRRFFSGTSSRGGPVHAMHRGRRGHS